MKYIITEAQRNKLYILRRVTSDWKWIGQIVKEGMDIYDPCDHTGVDGFLEEVIESSARSYLFHFLDDWKTDEFKTLMKFMEKQIYERYGNEIREYYDDYKPLCDEE